MDEDVQITGVGELDDDLPPLLKPGNYDVAFVKYSTAYMFGRAPKLVMSFKVIEYGDAFETELARYYNCKRLVGKPARNGGFKVGAKSDFLREFVTLFPSHTPRRLDRIPMSNFENKIIRARVGTVSQTAKQRAIPAALQYSVITELLKVKQG